MKVKCIDVKSPRSDKIPGGPTSITLGRVYDVAEILEEQYSIINDSMKMARYSQYRFEIVDYTPVLSIRENFNMLTIGMRNKIKLLKAEVERLKDANEKAKESC